MASRPGWAPTGVGSSSADGGWGSPAHHCNARTPRPKAPGQCLLHKTDVGSWGQPQKRSCFVVIRSQGPASTGGPSLHPMARVPHPTSRRGCSQVPVGTPGDTPAEEEPRPRAARRRSVTWRWRIPGAVRSVPTEAGESREERQSPQSPGQQPRPQGQHPDPHLPAAVVDEPQVDADFGFNLYQALHHGGRGSGRLSHSTGRRGDVGTAARPPARLTQVGLVLLAPGSGLFWAPTFLWDRAEVRAKKSSCRQGTSCRGEGWCREPAPARGDLLREAI